MIRRDNLRYTLPLPCAHTISHSYSPPHELTCKLQFASDRQEEEQKDMDRGGKSRGMISLAAASVLGLSLQKGVLADDILNGAVSGAFGESMHVLTVPSCGIVPRARATVCVRCSCSS